MELKSCGSEERNMAISIAVHCAPVIKGSKIANIVMISRSEAEKTEFLLRGTHISYFFLGAGRDTVILYLYRKEALREYLSRREIRDFLKDCGYAGGCLRNMLEQLSRRVSMHEDGKNSFPHEIGAFLGYPIQDIKGFIENQGKNFLYLGYWKVYHNVKETERLFRRYDAEREQAVEEIVGGKTIREIAV